MKKLTAELLAANDACPHGLAWFKSRFPGGTFCSRKDVVVAGASYTASYLQWIEWAARVLFDKREYGEFRIAKESTTAVEAFAYIWRRKQ